MPKWEYQIVVAEKYGKGILGFVMPKEISWKVHYVNGEQLQNWTEVTLYNYLSKMGDAGWEIVTMFSHTIIRTGTLPVEHLYITLKRQKE